MPASTSPNFDTEDHGRRVLLLPRTPTQRAAHQGAARCAFRGRHRRDRLRQRRQGLAARHGRARHRRRRRPRCSIGGARTTWPPPAEVTEIGFADAVAAAAVLVMGEAAKARQRPSCAASLDAAAPSLRAGAARGAGPVSMRAPARQLCCTLGRHRRREALAGSHASAGRSADRRRQHRRRLRASGPHVSPDVDTTLYTLAGRGQPGTGWGRRDETWNFMQATPARAGRRGSSSATAISQPTWSARGLRSGETLTADNRASCPELDVAARVLPMTDDPVRTIVETEAGTLAFQEYFVRDQCRPVVRRIRYAGADRPAHAAGDPTVPHQSRRRHHLPVESLAQRRSDPGGSGHARGDARRAAFP